MNLGGGRKNNPVEGYAQILRAGPTEEQGQRSAEKKLY